MKSGIYMASTQAEHRHHYFLGQFIRRLFSHTSYMHVHISVIESWETNGTERHVGLFTATIPELDSDRTTKT